MFCEDRGGVKDMCGESGVVKCRCPLGHNWDSDTETCFRPVHKEFG